MIDEDTCENERYYIVCEGHLISYINQTDQRFPIYGSSPIETLEHFMKNETITIENQFFRTTIKPDHNFILKLPEEMVKLTLPNYWLNWGKSQKF